jgi:hypothetical protein
VRAEAICGRLNKEIDKVKPASTSMREFARLAPSHAALELATVRELSSLSPPASIAGAWRQVIAYRRKLADELLQLGQAARAKDSARVRALGASKLTAHKKLLEFATRAGFKDCALVG